MTVAELKEALADYPDDMEVVAYWDSIDEYGECSFWINQNNQLVID